jgi:hypothetical protein
MAMRIILRKTGVSEVALVEVVVVGAEPAAPVSARLRAAVAAPRGPRGH